MSLTLYGLPNCDTCRKARKWLDAAGIDYCFIDYRAEPVPATRLKQWVQQLGGWDKLINKSSTSWHQLDDTQKDAASNTQWTQLIAGHPTLVRRPVVEADNDSVSVGFSEAHFKKRFGAG